MSADEVEGAVRRVEKQRPNLGMAVQAAADALTAGEGTEMIHQAALQQFLWWFLPRKHPEDEWRVLADAAAELLDELGMRRVADVARSARTAEVLGAWSGRPDLGAAAFRAAHGASGVEPPDTPGLAWGSFMGLDESNALDTVERALDDAIAAGNLVPGVAGWRAKAASITEAALTRPLDLPPGQTLAGLVTTERIGTWIDSARHPVHQEWRSSVGNRLLNRVEPPADPVDAVRPMHWLLELGAAQGGAELTQSNYLARASVVAAVERFGWWDWPKPPRSESDVHQLSVLRDAANRLRLTRRRGRHLYVTARGKELLQNPARLWEEVSTETEDGEDFTHMVTELVSLLLLRGRVKQRKLVAEVSPILTTQGWSTSGGPITVNHVSSAVWRPLRWWRIFNALDEDESKWEYGTGRELTPHTVALTGDGERMVLAYLRSRAAGPRTRMYK
ncbi:MAG: hypothetical protein ABSB99_02305 [Acidimicrobiales bacterium]|jgi:hypothetical protein